MRRLVQIVFELLLKPLFSSMSFTSSSRTSPSMSGEPSVRVVFNDVMPVTVPRIISSAMCCPEPSVAVFIFIADHIIAFFTGLGSLRRTPRRRASCAALPRIFSYSSCSRSTSSRTAPSSISGRMSDMDCSASWALR